MTGDQRKLVLLIALLVVLTLAQYVYGFLEADVQAVGDSVQATLHIAALALSFFAIKIAAQPKDEAFSYGYERVETLAAFTSCCFVVFSCSFTFVHNLHDVVVGSMEGHTEHAPSATASRLSRLGTMRFGANLLGLALFAQELRNAMRRATLSRGATLPAHSENLASVVMQLLASVANSIVVVASNAGTRLHWLLGGAELPLSLLSGVLVVYLALPPLLATARVLLLAIPAEVQPQLDKSLREVSFTDGILEVLQWNFWPVADGLSLVGTVSVRVRAEADEGSVRRAIEGACARVCADLTVQVVRDAPLDWLLASAPNTNKSEV
eukprot:gnl/TRDRNA2_/TRDRNA2_190789_c0_seq1.p1 gnl/TRDRNA2_/TRDRNA2_190789_c0~~gnl/TRDRNA2_/TRDRNA2_190789_c0_seq1.p1  ORF type:complete len:358 (-),score=63.25 gnl/TRDRNA2_/TRDRNA2_190789_c0_seq1:128-1099(-)